VIETFENAARAAAATVERVARTQDAVCGALRRATAGAQRIVVAEMEGLPVELVQPFLASPAVIPSPSDEQLATAEAGITEAFAGVARTGSVCIAIGSGVTPTASLLAPLHIALLPAERIVARPRDLFDPACLGGEGLRRSFVFTTGPSATADMGPLVRGVHGPHRLHVIVVE
jgi:L-lactate dehydrogenase complex protein LldG